MIQGARCPEGVEPRQSGACCTEQHEQTDTSANRTHTEDQKGCSRSPGLAFSYTKVGHRSAVLKLAGTTLPPGYAVT